MKRLFTLSYRLLGLMLALLALAGEAYASATAGTIKGVAVDDGGLAIPGVLVTLTSPSLIGGSQQRTTDAEGNFLFVELPPGGYELLAQKQGFSVVRKTGLEVSIGRTVQVTIEMQVGQEELTVEEARKTVDTEKASTGNVMNKDFLSRIPSGRSYQDVIGNTAGVTGGANPNSAGASSNENTWLLDGVNVTDPVTGTFSTNFNFDAIEEIEVITGGFDPEYGESLGAVISVVTKSGGNTLEVIAGGYYANGEWGPKVDAVNSADGYELSPSTFDTHIQTAQVSTLVSGPLVKDKVWFLGSYEYNRSLYQVLGTPLPRDFDGHYFFGKLTAQPSSQHRFTLQFSANPTTIDNIDQGDSSIHPEAFGRQAQGGSITSLKWNWFINPEANLETTASFQKSWINVNGVPCTHDEALGYHPCDPQEAENTVDYVTPGRIGTYGAWDSDNYGFYYFDDRYRAEISSKFSLLQVEFAGKHDIKVGVDGSYLAQDQVQGYNGNLIFFDLYENAFDPDTYNGFYWIETSGPYQKYVDGYHVAAFLQDVYKPIENLTFRYGVRYDHAVVRDNAADPVIDVGVFGPRIYAVWDPWADEKSKIFGGYGRFNDSGRLEIAGYFSESYIGQKVIAGEYFGNQTSNVAYNAQEVNKRNTIYALDDLVAPHSDEFKMGGEREIAPDIKAGIEFTGKFTRNVYTFDETNLIYDEDGYAYIGSRDSTLDLLYRMRTPAISMRDYFQTDFGIYRAFADRWLMNVVYSYVVSRGRVQDSLGGNLYNASQIELSYGNLPTDLRHQLKVQGAWDIPNDPWTTQIGAAVEYYSGAPISRYYYSNSDSVQLGGEAYALLKEPMGTYERTGPSWFMSVRLEQDIPAVNKGKLSAVAQIDNVTSNQYSFYYYYSYYVDSQNRYIAYYRQAPVTGQVGVKYEF
ncbi:MAG: TonB-dependent receptor [Myxococcota bacterium]